MHHPPTGSPVSSSSSSAAAAVGEEEEEEKEEEGATPRAFPAVESSAAAAGAGSSGATGAVVAAAAAADWKPKMCIIGINKKWNDQRLANYLTAQGVSFRTVKKVFRKPVAFVTFATPEEKAAGCAKISTLTGADTMEDGAKASGGGGGRNKKQGRPWLVADTKTDVNNNSKGAKGRRKRADLEGVGPDGMNKKQRLEQEAQKTRTARDAVTPHWRVPYDRQIAAKNDAMVNSLKRFRRRIRKEIVKAGKKSKGKNRGGGGQKGLGQTSNSNDSNESNGSSSYIGRDGVDWDREPVWLRPAGGFSGVLMDYSTKENLAATQEAGSAAAAAADASSSSSSSSSSGSPAFKFTHGLPCPMEPILGMTETVPSGGGNGGRFAYRNKCEFTVGRNRAGEIVLGFRVSSFGEGTVCESPRECGNVPEATKQLCASFEAFIRASALPIYDVGTHLGVWRQLTVQHSARTGHLRGMVQVKTLFVADEAWNAEQARMTRWCEENKATLGLTGMLIQYYDGPSMPRENDPSAVPKLLWGAPDLEEHLSVPGPIADVPTPTLKFLVSPGAFFQVNTPGCEKLYEIVGRYADADIGALQAKTDADSLVSDQDPSNVPREGEKMAAAKPIAVAADDETMTPGDGGVGVDGGKAVAAEEQDITLLDVCCGTGTIGLCVAASMPSVKKVVGVELCKAAVSDAKRNAELNQQGDTAHFFASAAEKMCVFVVAVFFCFLFFSFSSRPSPASPPPTPSCSVTPCLVSSRPSPAPFTHQSSKSPVKTCQISCGHCRHAGEMRHPDRARRPPLRGRGGPAALRTAPQGRARSARMQGDRPPRVRVMQSDRHVRGGRNQALPAVTL
jgi:hypothetical protein